MNACYGTCNEKSRMNVYLCFALFLLFSNWYSRCFQIGILGVILIV